MRQMDGVINRKVLEGVRRRRKASRDASSPEKWARRSLKEEWLIDFL